MKPSLRILMVGLDRPVALALRQALEGRGHQVSEASSAEEALHLPQPEVLVCDLSLRGLGADGLWRRLEIRDERLRGVLLAGAGSRTPETNSPRARVLEKPFKLDDLLDAVEAGSEPRRSSSSTLRISVTSSRGVVDRVARQLAAWALCADVGPTCRSRIATGVAEIADNVRRHAYGDGEGPVDVEATVDERTVQVTVRDEGIGFDAASVCPPSLQGPSLAGLGRASALSEDIRVESRPGYGTTVTLTFSVFRVDFDESASIDMTEMDFFTPDVSRRVLETLRSEDGGQIFDLSPALAVTVGRMLNGPDPGVALQGSLWG